MPDKEPESQHDSNLSWALQQIEDALRMLRFGSVTLLVQDGVVVQVDRTDRRRYQRAKGGRPTS